MNSRFRTGIAVVRQLLWHGRLDDAAEVLALMRGAVATESREMVAELRDTELWVASSWPPLARKRRVPMAEVKDAFSVASLRTDPGMRAASAVTNLLTGNHTEAALSTAEQILRLQPLRYEGVWDDEPTMLGSRERRAEGHRVRVRDAGDGRPDRDLGGAVDVPELRSQRQQLRRHGWTWSARRSAFRYGPLMNWVK